MRQANYFTKLHNQQVICRLCPHNCTIHEGKRGVCRVRKNINGVLYAETYGKLCSLNIDPIEKKPLYHFHPGSNILSVGSIGCNMRCAFCQNSDISQISVDNFPHLKEYTSEDIIKTACRVTNNTGIAYTYNEPTVWYEFMLDTARLAKEKNLHNIMVSNGYINKEPLEELLNYIDAFNIDLKSFTEDFYKNITSAKLEPVKQTIKTIAAAGRHLEITNLSIPTLNDDETTFTQMIQWLAEDIGRGIILHISRYFPKHEMKIESTSVSKLLTLYNIAKKHLNHVYLGNVVTVQENNTYCNHCGKTVIERTGYTTLVTGIVQDSNCAYCNNKIAGRLNTI